MMKQLQGKSGASVFQYALLPQAPLPAVTIGDTGKATLLIDQGYERKSQVDLSEGDTVQTGQKLAPFKDSEAYVVSSVGSRSSMGGTASSAATSISKAVKFFPKSPG